MQDLESAVREIQNGDDKILEELIISQKKFIYQYTSFICKRSLNWENDDELSIALIAFNRAIETFDTSLNKRFISYAKLLIKNSLIDFFRSQKDHNTLCCKVADAKREAQSKAETAASWEQYLRDIENRDRAYEIQNYMGALEEIGLTLEQLVNNSPDHSDTQVKMKEAAWVIAGDTELVRRIYTKKGLPLKEIQLITGINKRTLQKWRMYILSLVVLLTADDMETLVEYVWGRRRR